MGTLFSFFRSRSSAAGGGGQQAMDVEQGGVGGGHKIGTSARKILGVRSLTADDGSSYTLGSVLGVGGYATVYDATQAADGVRVAVKVAPAGALDNEIHVHSQVVHPGIAPVLASGALDARGSPLQFVVYPLYPTGLADYVQAHASASTHTLPDALQVPMDTPALIALIADLTHAVAALHAVGLAHRDIKPANIMLEQHPDGRFHPVIIDFGSVCPVVIEIPDRSAALAEKDKASQHTTGQFRAPELFDVMTGVTIDGRVDVWALGAALWSVAFHCLAFEDGTYTAAVARLRRPQRLQDNPDLEPIFTLCSAMCTVDHEERPSLDEVIALINDLAQE